MFSVHGVAWCKCISAWEPFEKPQSHCHFKLGITHHIACAFISGTKTLAADPWSPVNCKAGPPWIGLVCQTHPTEASVRQLKSGKYFLIHTFLFLLFKAICMEMTEQNWGTVFFHLWSATGGSNRVKTEARPPQCEWKNVPYQTTNKQQKLKAKKKTLMCMTAQLITN